MRLCKFVGNSGLCVRCGHWRADHPIKPKLLEIVVGWFVNRIVLTHPRIKHFLYVTLAHWMWKYFPTRKYGNPFWYAWSVLGYAGFYQVMWNEPELCRKVTN